jgi:hypothetical protein
MDLIKTTKHFRIESNGAATFFVMNSADACEFVTDTERKASNYVKRSEKFLTK